MWSGWGETRDTCGILMGRWSLGKARRIWEENIKTDIKRKGY